MDDAQEPSIARMLGAAAEIISIRQRAESAEARLARAEAALETARDGLRFYEADEQTGAVSPWVYDYEKLRWYWKGEHGPADVADFTLRKMGCDLAGTKPFEDYVSKAKVAALAQSEEAPQPERVVADGDGNFYRGVAVPRWPHELHDVPQAEGGDDYARRVHGESNIDRSDDAGFAEPGGGEGAT